MPYFVSYATVGWIDLFTRNEYKDIVLNSLEYCCQTKGLEVYAWCVMTNHVHLIIGTKGNKLQDIMRDHKRHTSETLRAEILRHPSESRREWMMKIFTEAGKANSNNRGFQLWQQDNHPIELNTATVLYQKLDYLHNNPVKAGYVDFAQDWRYSSARDYAGIKGLLNSITLIEIGYRES
jgi:REP element-mobilizing transposase RayT